jgi:hypothetical protein
MLEMMGKTAMLDIYHQVCISRNSVLEALEKQNCIGLYVTLNWHISLSMYFT